MTEYKSFTPTEFKSDSHGSAQFIIATTGVLDSDGDVLLPGAIGQQIAVVIPAHDWQSQPLGKARISEQGDHIVADVSFNPTPSAQAWFSAIKWDFQNPPAVQEYSWGYTPTQSNPGDFHGTAARYLESVTIHEVSPVIRAASIGSRTAGVKQHDTLSPSEWAILRAARHEADDIETELKNKLRAIAEAFHAGEESLYADRVAVEANEAMGHQTEIVPAATVSANLKSAALAATKLAAKQLNTKTPELRWFTQPDEITLLGRALPSKAIIYLNDQLTLTQSIIVAAHECGHCAGFTEQECLDYEREFLERTLLQ